MSLTRELQPPKLQILPMSQQSNSVDCGLHVLLDAAKIVQQLTSDSTDSLPPILELRSRIAADLYKGELLFTTNKNADPKPVCRTIETLCTGNNDMLATHETGQVVDNIPVTKKMLHHYLGDLRLTTDDMNAPLQLLRGALQGNHTIAILDAEFYQRAERSVTDKTVASKYLNWMRQSHGDTFDFTQVNTVWMPMYLADPSEADGGAAHWWRLLYDTSSGTFNRGCSLGNEADSMYSAQETVAKAFLMKIIEVYISPYFSPRSLKHDCAYYSGKRTIA